MPQALYESENRDGGMIMTSTRRGKVVSYNKWGYIFLIPFVVVYLLFSFVPLISTIYNSFFENYRSGLTQIGPNFIGLENFKAILTSGEVWVYAQNTMIMWLLGFVPQILISLLLGAWFSDPSLQLKCQGFFKTVIYLPNLIMASAFAMLFFTLFFGWRPSSVCFGFCCFLNTTRSHSELNQGFSIIPSKYLFSNIQKLIKMGERLPILTGLLNSLLVAGLSAVLSTYFSVMTAYAIHAYDFKLKKFMFTFILMIMMIPTQVTALGFLQLVSWMRLEDSFIPLIVPSIAAPVTFFYMKQYMESSLPLSLIEAARIDGSGEFRTFNSIVMPLMKPAIAVQAIFTFVSSWNNYFTPALILHDPKKRTIPILIAQLRSMDWSNLDTGVVYAMIALSIFPVIIVYLFLSKHIVQGVAMGSVKG